MRKGMTTFVALVSLLAVAGCRHLGGADEGDAGTSTDTGTIVDTDTGISDDACSMLLSETCTEIDEALMTTVLDADSMVGVDVTLEFISMGDRAVLASLYDGTGPGPAVFFANPWIEGADEWDHVAYLPDGASGLSAVGIAGASGLFDAGGETILYDVLLSGDVGCGIWGVVKPPEDSDLEQTDEITGLFLSEMVLLTAIPIAGAATLRGIATDYPSSAACVYGDGIYCTTGDGWSVEVMPGTGGLFNDMESVGSLATGGVEPVAVGDGGRMVVKRDGAWLQIETSTSKNLLNVSNDVARYLAGGEDGVVASLPFVSPPLDEAALAFAGSDDVVKAGIACEFGAHSDDPSEIEGLTSGGCAFVVGPAGVTDCWTVPLHPGPALDLTIFPFSSEEEFSGKHILTRETLYRYGTPE